MTPTADRITSALRPYRDILVFAVCLFAANYFWKFTIVGDDETNSVLWFGLNISRPFQVLSEHVAQMAYGLTCFFTDTVHFVAPRTVAFDSGFSYEVVWSCTALKQSFIWLIIMIFASGSRQRKLWFIPLGWLVAYAFNILRIAAIGLLCEHHPDLFGFYHEFLFKYLFYAILFALWVWWIERLSSSVTT